MLQIGLFTIIQFIVFTIYRRYKKETNWTTFFLMFQLTSQYLIIEHDIGPVSLRVYNIVFLIIVTIYFNKYNDNNLYPIKSILILWISYLLWILLSASMNGSLNAPGFWVSYLSSYIMGMLILITFGQLIKNTSDVDAIVLWMTIIAIVNILFVIAQGLSISFAWNLHNWLFPIATARMTEIGRFSTSEYIGYLPGLSSYSIETAYILLCFGLLLGIYFYKAINRTKKFLSIIVYLLILVTTIGGGYFTLSRSSFYLGCIFSIAILWFKPREKLFKYRFLFVAIFILGVYNLYENLSSSTVKGLVGFYNFNSDRLYKTNDDRLEIWNDAFRFIEKNPQFGGVALAYSSKSITKTPHNFLINSALYYGLPSVFIISLFVIVLIRTIIKSTKRAVKKKSNSLDLYVYVISIIAYICKGFVHNDSFATGGIMGWTLLSLWYARLRLINNSFAKSNNGIAPINIRQQAFSLFRSARI